VVEPAEPWAAALSFPPLKAWLGTTSIFEPIF